MRSPDKAFAPSLRAQEARLGSPAYCGISSANHSVSEEPGTSIIAFAHAGRSILLAVRQKLRPDAVAVVQALAARDYEIVILSGDRPAAVAPVAAALGVTAWRGGLKPAEKISAIEALKANGRRVLMVGDGLNDAPALAAAHVALSPISAVDITQMHADAVFLGDRLAPVLDAIVIAKRARHLMLQNLWLAVIYNAIAVPIAMAGFVTPLIAAIAMSGSSLLVTIKFPARAAAGAQRICFNPQIKRAAGMNVLVYLVPMALMLGLIGLVAFVWSLKSGQYDDIEGSALRMLSDDDTKP